MRAPLTPIKAFVQDAARRGLAGDASSVEDPRLSQWLLVAQAAERLAELKPAQRGEYVKLLGSAVLPARAGRPTQIEGDGRGPTDAIAELAERLRLEAEDMERAGCFELALTTVSSVCQMLARGSLTARLLATAHLGRVVRQIGELDSAVDCYTTIRTEAEAANDRPIVAHGLVGLGIIAHARGNRPAQKSFFLEALECVAKGSPLELSVHQGLLITANQEGHLADALLHGWRVHDLAPPDSDVQFETIGNLANTAFKGGFYSAATAGYDYMIQRASLSRHRLPAIGGGMRAAAMVRNVKEVDELERLGRLEVERASLPYESARFLFDAAESRQLLGDAASARSLIDASVKIADVHGYHELRVSADVLMQANGQSAPKARDETGFVAAGASFEGNPVIRVGIQRLRALSHA